MKLDDAFDYLKRQLPEDDGRAQRALDYIKASLDRASELALAIVTASDCTGCTEDMTVTSAAAVAVLEDWLRELDKETTEVFPNLEQLQKDFDTLVREVANNVYDSKSALFDISPEFDEVIQRRGIELH